MNSIEHFLMTNCRGKENAVTSPDLEAMFGMKGSEIRKTINRLRSDGKPICSGQTGYYYAASTEEIQKTIRNLDGRIAKINRAKIGLLKTMNKENNNV